MYFHQPLHNNSKIAHETNIIIPTKPYSKQFELQIKCCDFGIQNIPGLEYSFELNQFKVNVNHIFNGNQ